MAKKPLTYVRLEIARLGLELGRCKNAEEKIAWIESFHEALVLQDPSLNKYAADLLQEARDFAESMRESANKRWMRTHNDPLPTNADPMGKSATPMPDQIRSDQIIKREENTAMPAAQTHKKSQKAEKDADYPIEVYRVYNFWKDRVKASARKADALKWIARRGKEHGFERLIMAVVRYRNECTNLGTEEKFFKDCANFFGEDAAFEGFLPPPDWATKYRTKAEAIVAGKESHEAVIQPG